MVTGIALLRRFASALLVIGASTSAAGAVDTHLPTAAPPKFALVIGNSQYSGNRRSLKNPVNDARLMAQSLRQLGFNVRQHTDLDRAGMAAAVGEFATALPEGATALVFYAGHGMQIGGASYLIPVDMAVTSEQSVPLRAYPLKALLERVSASRSAVNVVVLDACRDNPFQPAPAVKYRSFANLGLAPVQAPRGTLVAYSTAPGQLAADGSEDNSVYTAALARVMLEPRLPLEGIFKKVGEQVRKKTWDDQIPWFESSLSDEYFFLPPAGVTVTAGRAPQAAEPPRTTGKGKANMRGGGTGTRVEAAAWYRSLTESEWSQLDWEIQQRVKHLTEDELPRLEHQARGGSVVAQTVLGLAWQEGVRKISNPRTGQVYRTQSNNTKALQWLRWAVQAEFPVAQAELAEMYYKGQGLARDRIEARRLIESAAQASYPRAKLDLLQMRMEEGNTSSQDALSAVEAVMRGFQAPRFGK